MKNLSKRTFVKLGLAGTLGVTGLLDILTSVHAAETKQAMTISSLIDALRSINNPVCDAAAVKLLSLKDNNTNYDLHLRSAGLNIDEIQRIAEAIKSIHAEGGSSLRSFSMSYNPNLRDGGALNLVAALPATLTEIGLVGCGLTDEGGEALITWAAKAPKLHWLCVEQNTFSRATRDRFKQLGQARNGLLVVV